MDTTKQNIVLLMEEIAKINLKIMRKGNIVCGVENKNYQESLKELFETKRNLSNVMFNLMKIVPIGEQLSIMSIFAFTEATMSMTLTQRSMASVS
jgi:hypothetical protein